MRPSVLAVLPAFLLGCQPPPASPSRAVVQLYMHPNGLSRCVEEDGDRWKADPSCCPTGWTLAGFAVPGVTAYPEPGADDGEGNKVNRRLYRHVVCVEGALGGG